MLRNSVAIVFTALIAASTAVAQDPYANPDGSWISLSGKVVSPTSDSFMLDYGDGVVRVEVDDWDNYGDAYGLLDGDAVTVTGIVDDELYETTSIEASSIYVESLNTYFYASADDEESNDVYWTVDTPIVVGEAVLRGTVSSVDVSEGEFTIDTGLQQVTVSSEQLGYNPVDEYGFQQIDIGDRVSVGGDYDSSLFDNRELEAEAIVTLEDDSSA